MFNPEVRVEVEGDAGCPIEGSVQPFIAYPWYGSGAMAQAWAPQSDHRSGISLVRFSTMAQPGHQSDQTNGRQAITGEKHLAGTNTPNPRAIGLWGCWETSAPMGHAHARGVRAGSRVRPLASREQAGLAIQAVRRDPQCKVVDGAPARTMTGNGRSSARTDSIVMWDVSTVASWGACAASGAAFGPGGSRQPSLSRRVSGPGSVGEPLGAGATVASFEGSHTAEQQ
jgi:hypothetical protein